MAVFVGSSGDDTLTGTPDGDTIDGTGATEALLFAYLASGLTLGGADFVLLNPAVKRHGTIDGAPFGNAVSWPRRGC